MALFALPKDYVADRKKALSAGVTPMTLECWLDRRYDQYRTQCDWAGVAPKDFEGWRSLLEPHYDA